MCLLWLYNIQKLCGFALRIDFYNPNIFLWLTLFNLDQIKTKIKFLKEYYSAV